MPKKLSDEKREQAKAIIYLNPDVSEREIAKAIGIGNGTAHALKKELMNSDEYEQLRAQKKEEFILAAWETVKKLHLKIDEKLEAMSPDELKKVNIRDLAVALGTIYDKQALASGEPTIISERHEPMPELVKELESKVDKLKQMTGT